MLCLCLATVVLAFAAAAPSAPAAAATGGISGTVTDASHVTLGHISVTAYQADGSGGWDYAAWATTAGDGTYSFSGLAAGIYRLQFRDGSDVYLTQFYAGEADLDSADDVAVTAGATTADVDVTLVKAGHVSGTVSTATHATLDGIDVAAYQPDGSGGWDRVGTGYTTDGGSYDVGGLTTGVYRLQFRDSSGVYAPQCYSGKADLDSATDVSVTAGATTSGIDVTLAKAGRISGTVTDAAHAGLAGIGVDAYRSDGSGGWNEVVSGFTAADGGYDLGGLGTGVYRLEFWDGSGAYADQCYAGKPDLDTATDVSVAEGATTTGINVTLAAAAPVTSGWIVQSTPLLYDNLNAVSFADSTHGWAVGSAEDPSSTEGESRGVILATTDGGATWKAQTPPAGTGLVWDVSFVDASHGWAVGGISGILATADGGATWIKQSLPPMASDVGLSAVSFADANHGWVVGSAIDDATYVSTAVIFATTNGGATWSAQSLPSGVAGVGLKDVGFVDANHGWAAGQSGRNAVTLATTDGGVTWSAKTAPVGANDWLMSFSFVDADHGWTSGADEVVLATADGGASWNEQTPPEGGFGLQVQGIGFSDVGHGWAVGSDGIAATVDGGVNWSQQTLPTGACGVLHGVTSIDATHAWAVGVVNFGTIQRGVILRTTTGGFPVAPTLTGFTPASGLVGASVTLTGTSLTGATAVAFNGVAATSFTVDSATQITATVPAGATTGKVSVTTPGGTATSTASFTVTAPVVTPALTLKLSGLKSGALKLGKSLTAKGTVTPISLAGSKVTLTVQQKKGTKWVKAKTASATISSTGAYGWQYKPAKKGSYRVQATVAQTAANAAAKTAWRSFKVK